MSNRKARPKVVRAAQPPPETITMSIIIPPDAPPFVEGPLNDPIRAYGILRIGEKLLDAYYDALREKMKNEEPRIIVPGTN